MRTNNREPIITILWIGCLFAAILAGNFWQKDRLFSQTENRILASRPKVTWQDVRDGTFQEDYETYLSDQFFIRDSWMQGKTFWDITLGKKEINGVYLAKDNYFIEQHLPEDMNPAVIEKRKRLLYDLIAHYEETLGQGNIQVMLVPTADVILEDKLPKYAPRFLQEEVIEDIKAELGDTCVVDVRETLQEHNKEAIYYKTDHHWTTLGAYYAFLEWKDTSIQPQWETVSEDFLGTLHSKINFPAKPDTIERMIPEEKCRVSYDFGAKVQDSLYEPKHLQTKNKYGYFLDDNHAFIEIQTKHKNGRTLFVIKDSYANCFIPFLTKFYETICIVDLRYYKMGLYELIDRCEPTDILVLYNMIHFLEEFQFYN